MTTALLARCPTPVASLPPWASGPTLPLSVPKTLQFSMPKTLQFSMPIDSGPWITRGFSGYPCLASVPL